MQRLTLLLAMGIAGVSLAAPPPATTETGSWDTKGAAAYLDQRAEWWVTWPQSARDHGTFCVSCHTALPYALGRPALRSALTEQALSPSETKLVENITKRVRNWSEMEPFYSDEKQKPPKTAESRGTEAVLNALILTNYDAHAGKLGPDARTALENMWALQLQSGDAKGAWTWLNFHNEPWEADDSQFWGATLGAIAAGKTPKDYRESPDVRGRLEALTQYLQHAAEGQSLINRTFLLWASAKLPGLLTTDQQHAIIHELFSKQQADGGWSTTSIVLSTWKRRDGTALATESDGYATGLITYAVEQVGAGHHQAALKNALSWLVRNQSNGLWMAYSLNKQRDPASDVGRFMVDAATAYSVLALSAAK